MCLRPVCFRPVCFRPVCFRPVCLAFLAGTILAAPLATAPASAQAAGLVVADAAGTEAPLDAVLAGRPTVLHLWATWCGPCVAELPELAALLEARPDLAADLILLSVDRAPMEDVTAFLRDRLGLDIASLKVVEGRAETALGITGYPTTLFLAADGTVSLKMPGTLDWDSPSLRATVAAHLGRP